MDKKMARAKMIVAMEYVARQINDEDVFDGWLMNGVADGEIPYGNLDPTIVDDYWLEDDNFSDLMACFLRRMKGAYDSGGLYCGGVVSRKWTKPDIKE